MRFLWPTTGIAQWKLNVIDTQTHYVAPKAAMLLDALVRMAPVQGIARPIDRTAPIFGLDERLRAMDAAGVATSVLSFAPISVVEDSRRRIELCRAANDGLVEACAAHPDRFVMAAFLPLPDAEAAVAELDRLLDENSLRALFIVAQSTGYRPDDPELEPLFAKAAGAGLPVILHPTAGIADLAPQFDAYGLASGLHAMVSHSLVAARIIQSGLMDRVDGLELILTHLGGVLPFLAERLDSRHFGATLLPPSDYLKRRVFLDNCGYAAGPAFRCALATVGAGRILIGSDWPSRPIEPAIESVRNMGLDAANEESIMTGNAARWFDPRQRREA